MNLLEGVKKFLKTNFNLDLDKKKRQEEYEAKYASKSLDDLAKSLDEKWKIQSKEELDYLYVLYGRKLFSSPKSAGGFEIPEEKLKNMDWDFKKWVGEGGACYHYDGNGTIVSINRKLLFAANYMHVNPGRYPPVSTLFSADYIENLTDADIMNEHHPVYNPWIYETNEQEGSAFTRAKANIILMMNDPDCLERYGMFRRKNGVVTDEYVTIDDFLEIKTNQQLGDFLDYIQTRDPEETEQESRIRQKQEERQRVENERIAELDARIRAKEAQREEERKKQQAEKWEKEKEHFQTMRQCRSCASYVHCQMVGQRPNCSAYRPK